MVGRGIEGSIFEFHLLISSLNLSYINPTRAPKPLKRIPTPTPSPTAATANGTATATASATGATSALIDI